MKANVGGIDKILRIVIGAALITWVLLGGGPNWAWIVEPEQLSSSSF
ncbi:MAG: hypothetical protein CVU29_11545 [Betaproteobacteria bacterium HGW-Betaproteobacteria-22]|nr:MAG: hypothetical protein CVU29_11545 [Betaproteobacteria bacterium HGW-Betaproteobacteria-22]